jgi:hypothetical protein
VFYRLNYKQKAILWLLLNHSGNENKEKDFLKKNLIFAHPFTKIQQDDKNSVW